MAFGFAPVQGPMGSLSQHLQGLQQLGQQVGQQPTIGQNASATMQNAPSVKDAWNNVQSILGKFGGGSATAPAAASPASSPYDAAVNIPGYSASAAAPSGSFMDTATGAGSAATGGGADAAGADGGSGIGDFLTAIFGG